MVRYEATQPGNPHKLTIRQHLLPRKTIERFCGPDERVHVQFVQTDKVARHRPASELFCAMRAWDQKAEATLGKSIEDAFQAIAERLCAGTLDSLAHDMHKPVTEMYLLWRHRCLRARKPIPDLQVVGITGDPTLDRDRQEWLEARGIMFFRPDGTWPGRMAAGISLRKRPVIPAPRRPGGLRESWTWHTDSQDFWRQVLRASQTPPTSLLVQSSAPSRRRF